MCIDGIGVEEIVLHATDDAPKRGDVAPEHTIRVHAAQFVRDACGCPQDFEKEAMVLWVLPELFVDQPEILDDGADGVCAHALDRRVLLQQGKHLEQRRRLAHEDLIVQRFQIAVANLKARIEWFGCRTLIEDGFAKELQEQLVQQ